MGMPLVLNIQKFSVHDGPGIRTTVFFKGCPLACRWCHNPESQSFHARMLTFPERCTGCGACISACPHGCNVREPEAAVVFRREGCAACGACADACAWNAREVAGRAYAPRELAALLTRDRIFYENSDGGVTLSGGEALAQDMAYMEELLRGLRAEGIHIAVDTCGHVAWERFRAVLPYVDMFLYDLKAVGPDRHRRFTGVDNGLILENLRRLGKAGAYVHLRVPVIGGFNDMDVEMNEMIRVAQDITRGRGGGSPPEVSLLPYHGAGREKWARTGLETPESFQAPGRAFLEDLAHKWRDAGFASVEIGG